MIYNDENIDIDVLINEILELVEKGFMPPYLLNFILNCSDSNKLT